MANILLSLANGRKVPFEIDTNRPGPARFVLGVQKCGSSLLNMLARHLALLNDQPYIEFVDVLFRNNIPPREWLHDPAILALLHNGNTYGGFRSLPFSLANEPIFRDGPKFLMVRDPRDAMTSLYFSNAYSHPIPERNKEGSSSAELMEASRKLALSMSIDEFIMRRLKWMVSAFTDYSEVARSPLTKLVRYEDYIFKKPELIGLIATHFGWKVTEAQIDDMMIWADRRPQIEDPTAFVRKVTPGDHKEKLQPATITKLNSIMKPALELFGYV